MKRFLAISVFLGGCLLLWGQFREDHSLYGGIETANYFASLLGAMVATVWLVKPPAILYRGEVAVFALFVYLMVHVYATRGIGEPGVLFEHLLFCFVCRVQGGERDAVGQLSVPCFAAWRNLAVRFGVGAVVRF